MAQELTKRIPVSEQRWKQLGEMKQAGQTYDELLRQMAIAYNRRKLAEKARAARRGEGNWYKLEDV